MRIRDYRPPDAPLLAALYARSVRGIGPRFYTPEQVEAWAAQAPTVERVREAYGDGRVALVAVDEDDQPVAFSDVESDGHINFLYCAPEAAGQGVMSALVDLLEARAKALGHPRLHVEASEAARPFFLRRGFTLLERRDLRIGDVPIHNYAMEKWLAPKG
ncbi:putative acetyltransferase [Azospirillum lipoferum]|uniref:GNAT family N-acetyltransferase n=1 Tax=Azospirillum lipoferum TaxID=193 RepID=A0A5A9GD09_AZOLI|nr:MULTISPECIES: GNAT family N-acetyltransferase [Azospirillum]KAA0592343.1 GNAT family N-acetyltransferase [Azospirillum lipoferum]MCP1614629.1 putative acetyltransferase [Azospirillum lipoferum]MDW5532540.1 GNAT family N-acetyltransferase [Azospirillum sp. NL1]